MTTGQRIKKMREGQGLTQSQLGSALNKSQGTIAKYETDSAEMDYATLCHFCDLFGCSTDYLLGRVDDPHLEIRKAPSEDGAKTAYVEVDRNAPEFSDEEIKALWKFLDSQRGN